MVGHDVQRVLESASGFVEIALEHLSEPDVVVCVDSAGIDLQRFPIGGQSLVQLLLTKIQSAQVDVRLGHIRV